MELPRIDTISKIGQGGTQYILVMLKEPALNNQSVVDGGLYVHFDIDHKKQTTTAYKFWFQNGGGRTEDKPLRRWRDEILTEQECLKCAAELFGGKELWPKMPAEGE